MNKFLTLAATMVALAAAPAVAATYVAFDSFNGANGNNGFFYGYTNGATLTAFDGSTTGAACALGAGSTCLFSTSQGALPQASVGGSFPTVSVPTDAILVHPGDSSQLSVYGGFVAATAGSYTYTIDLKSVGIDTTNGIGYTTFTSIGGVVTLGARSVLPTYQSLTSLSGTQLLAAGQTFGVIVDSNGNYGGDSTGLNFTISNVPEPATWGLMIAGFVMVGFAARRRQTTVAA